MSKENKIGFVVTLKNGEKVDVTYEPDFIHHLAFRGNISETGYRSEFPFAYEARPSLDEVKEMAQFLAQKLYNANPAKHGTMQPLL